VPYTCTYPSLPSPGTNSATPAWDNSSSATGTASVDFSKASIKAVDDSVTVTDTLGGTLGTVSSADPSPTTFTYSHAVAGTAGTCVSQDNTAAFTTNTTGTTGSDSKTVKDCEGADLQVSKKAVASFTSSIAKSVDKTEIDTTSGGSATFNYSVKVTESGWKVSGNIAVTNPNDWEAITANLSDALTDTGGTCVINGGTTSVTVAQSSSSSIPYSCTFASAPGAASGSNTVIATWDAVAANTPESSASSGTVSYAFGSLTVTDSFKGALGTITAPAASTTYTYSRTITAPSGTCSTIPNTATITQTSQSSGKSVTVCGWSPLTFVKTAKAAFNSNINKTGPASPVEKSGSSTLNYNITVTESGWNVAGTITLANPNSVPITASISDPLCSAANFTGVIVGANSSTTPPISYTCSLTSAQVMALPAYGGTNTAGITWAANVFVPAGSASSNSTGYNFQTLTITDAFNGANPAKTLGTVAPGTASKTFTDSYTVMVTGGTCVPYPNIATISETGQTSNKTVTVCNTATGALTMGFWQNKNGQAIITGGASSSGVCNSGAWLRLYAPFQDLSATASCSLEATYVYNLIKAANASGSSMNAMLKAQMLATSLDVYFSDPALGGNKIAAAQPIGGEKIDLTKVCVMIDSSTGTGSCSGNTESTSGAFGGATSGTVSFLLTYAAGQSNSGGSVWYGQIKTTQGLAKNTFDAINNHAAYIAP